MLVFWGIYYVLLRREKAFVFNRFYLLLSPFFALYFPFWISEIQYVEIHLSELITLKGNFSAPEMIPSLESTSSSLWLYLLGGLYLLGLCVMLVIYSRNLKQIYDLIQKGHCHKEEDFSYIIHQENFPPFSFWKYIFLSQQDFQKEGEKELLIKHESSHIRQKHSLDLLLIELLHAFLWFNPLLILYKKSIRLNHEFLADEAVLKRTSHPKAYLELMLERSHKQTHIALASPLRRKAIKERFQMIFTSNKRMMKTLSPFLTLCFICGFFQLFGKVEYKLINSEKEESSIFHTIPDQKLVLGEQEPEIFYDLNSMGGGMLVYTLVPGKKARYVLGQVIANREVRFLNAQGKQVQKMCKDLSQEEREWFWKLDQSKAESFYHMPAEKKLTEAQLKDFLNPNRYGLWLDGKKTANTELLKYKKE
ncbi:MAG: M56 family metallopeptidase, partial [Bacteroidota bacterium]